MTNPFDEYINKLEGNSDIDPLAIVRDLRELHTQEIGTREAKIDELNGSVAEKDTNLSAKDEEIREWKAKNLDLVMQIPANHNQNVNQRYENEKPSGSAIRIADLFNKEVRNRHGL